ncbi:MAG TPA: protein kinase [Pyrinomonadaceae bacterium]|nr:protein kinase [Pyrinomonadaceae bacterium]
MNISQGTKLGRYEIRSRLGSGGMGEVYLAQDTELARTVALKILPAEFTTDQKRLQRFFQEARAASSLNHPNILTIYEIGQADSSRFIVTEFIDGETLRRRISRSTVIITEALDVAIQVASALSAAHAAGIVHRDIKPENIMVRRDGIVKVLDFGLAKLTEPQQTANEIDTSAPTKALIKTEPGVVMGTTQYMSPEQARGLRVDERTDIWSLGVVLYELVAGIMPFKGQTASDTIASILKTEQRPLSSLVAEVPAEMERIVSKALEKEAGDRYQTSKDLLVDLRHLKKRVDFEAELERSREPESTAQNQQIAPDTRDVEPARPTSSVEYIVSHVKQHKRIFALATFAVLVAAIGLSYWLFTRPTTNAAPIESIAVMPFINESGNADNEYLSDGMTESLIGSLSQLPRLSVKARASVFRYKGKAVDPHTVGLELSVQAVLLGRVTARGEMLTLSLELVDARTENVIWSEQYNRRQADLVSLQSEIARDVANKLRVKLSGSDEQKLTKNYTANGEAYQLYLKGQYEWNKHTQADLQRGIEYFNQAIEVDPNYALAYSGLADSYGVLGNNYLPPNEAFPKAKAYAAKALAIDDTLAEAHTSMGAVRLFYDWNWAEAEKELKRAQTLNPNETSAHDLYSAYFEVMGQSGEAQAEGKRAQELDPLSPMMNTDIGIDSYYWRRYDEAIAQLEKTIHLEQRYVLAWAYLGQAYEQKKMYAQAIETFQKGMTQAERHPQLLASLGHAYALAGERDKALKALDELREMSKQRYISPYSFAVIYAGLDDKEQAFAWLNKAYQDRSFFLIWLKVEPQFDSLRDDPRFQGLLRSIGLPQ